jgi:hypothetical protein
MTTMTVSEYIRLVKSAHTERGAIEGQRDIVRTTSAKRIRERMIADLHRGAILPPLVLGIVLTEEQYNFLPLSDERPISSLSPTALDVAIIDGMQRTGALIEAAVRDPRVLDQIVRVEFWLAQSVSAMVYRMLVLNTGQVPWTLARQLSVVYSPLIAEIEHNVPNLSRLLGVDKAGRRVGPAQFSADALVELYLAFSLRKTNVDTKESLSDEFAKLDFVENLSRRDFQKYFYDTLNLLCLFDIAFSKFNPMEANNLRYNRGRNIFDSQPARIGFMAALAQFGLGRPGSERSEAEISTRFSDIERNASALLERLNTMNLAELETFLALGVLREKLDVRTSQVGRFERQVFFDAFKALIEDDFSVNDLEQCWRAH